MRRGCWIGLMVGACLQLAACTDHNPRYRPRVVTDGGGGSGGADQSPGLDLAEIPDAEAFDQPPGPDLNPVADATVAPDEPPGLDGPPVVQDGASPDVVAVPDTAVDLPPDAFVPPAGCGTVTSNVSSVMNADGVVVDTDGTIYTLTDDATHSYVGRIPPGGTADPRWLRVDNSPTTWGLALDSANARIYVLVVDGTGALVRYSNIKTNSPGGEIFYSPVLNGNDVVVGPEGDVYYTQQEDRNVYAVNQARVRRKVSTTQLGSTSQLPAALTFEPSGNLLVGLEEGPLYRLTVTGSGMEGMRTQLTGWTGWANGLTHDRRGRLFASLYHDTQPRSVLRLDFNNNIVVAATTVASNGRFSSIAFGRGPLDCRDLYIADPFGPMRRVRIADVVP
jgi:hypothetical protein